MTDLTASTDENIQRPSGMGWLRFGLRLLAIAVVIFGLIPPMILARFLGNYQISQGIVGFACRMVLHIIGLPVVVSGQPMNKPGGNVSNHISWMDIFVLNSYARSYFVAKSEVSTWPLIGWIARSVGTVFIERRRSQAASQKSVFTDRITNGQRLLFFPEGTSTTGEGVLGFRSTLFAAFFEPDLVNEAFIQPVSIRYFGPKGHPTFYAWYGTMDFAPHFMAVLAAKRQGRVSLAFHDPLKVSDYPDRKALSRAAEQAVHIGFDRLS